MTSNAQTDRDEGGTAGPAGDRTPEEPPRADAGAAFAELRSIIVGRDLDELTALRGRFDPESFASAVGDALPDAIEARVRRDDRLTEALTPTIEGAVRESVRKDSHVLVDALFPVMGPAIRKAVAAAIGEMIQSLNRTLENSLSIRGLRWRLEALRTGKSFAEVALLHSLVYRVEQVFLIHTETGLLLQHLVAPGLDAPDGELVSGMLTAIQDFVHDSLGAGATEMLDAVRVGALAVWIERGPHATVAGVLRGEAPAELRHVFQDALGGIHAEQQAELEGFAGDAGPFVACRPRLEACFDARYEAGESKLSPQLVIAASVLGVLLLGWLAYVMWYHHKWNAYVDDLRSRPGIVVTDERIGWRQYEIAGLRDPLAREPASLLVVAGIDPSEVKARWYDYYSSEPEFVVERATSILAPPSTVTLRVADRNLVAEGLASRAWIEEARRLARLIPGVAGLDERALRDADTINEKLESTLILFQTNTTDLAPGQEAAVAELTGTLRALQATPEWRAAAPRFEIVGHTDSTGSEATNARLSEERAQRIIQILGDNGVDVSGFGYRGVSTAEPVRAEKSADDAAFNRSVTVRVITEKDRKHSE
jgi:OOP family OmpA-OmpF porin